MTLARWRETMKKEIRFALETWKKRNKVSWPIFMAFPGGIPNIPNIIALVLMAVVSATAALLNSFNSMMKWIIVCLIISITPYLKFVFAIFIKFLFFHQMITLQNLWKMFFISSKKLFSFSRYSIFLYKSFFPFLPTLSRLKRTNRSGITYDVINWLEQICRCNFWRNHFILYRQTWSDNI